MTKSVLLFLKATQPIFDQMNTILQKDEPQIHLLTSHCTSLLTDVLVRFVKASAITASKDIFSVKYSDRQNQKDRDVLVIGTECKQYLTEMKSQNLMSSRQRNEFYSGVRQYYVKAVDYILARLPIHDTLLNHVQVFDIEQMSSMTFESVLYFVERFPLMMGISGGENKAEFMDELEQEFLKCQVDQIDVQDQRIDTVWHNLRQKYPKLAKVALGVLSIPHSNAESERVFSAVRRTDTEFRPNMSTKLLESLVTTKTWLKSHNIKCYDSQFPESLLKEAKSATYKALSGSLSSKTVPEESDVCANLWTALWSDSQVMTFC